LGLATVGLGLNLRAWILLGPQLHERFDVELGEYVLLMGLPLLVAALVRLPVGVLTDRYGARVMFPLVSLAAAASVFGLGLADSLQLVVVAGSAAGVAGAAFVVGAALVSRIFPYGRRGLALGILSIGPAVAVVVSAVSRGFDPGGRTAAVVLGGLLAGFAGLSAVVFRDDIAGHRVGAPIRRCAEMIRLASGTPLSLLYALALGGLMATAVYLPVYLVAVFHLEWFHALVVTGAVVGLAAVARLIGGWRTDRRPTVRLLTVCYAAAAGLCLVAALEPRLWLLTAPLIAAIAMCVGAASGALLALIGKAARADSVGAVMGVTGAAAALGALLPPLLLAGVDRLSDSYSLAWILLSAALLAVALYVRAHGLGIGLGLAVRYEPEHSPTAMTLAVVDESDTQLGAAAVVARLAELAASDELVVVYGSDEPSQPRLSTNVLVTGLRDRLPRHGVVGIRATFYTGALRRLASIVGEFVETGTVAVAVAPPADLPSVATELSSYLGADRVVKMSYTLADGADLQEVWSRNPASTHGGSVI
jgi:NNP family nitrate/nitrite transporter-like MFS transporter